MGRLLPGHRAQLLLGGGQLFPAMCAAIDAAQHHVWLEAYILQVDEQTRALMDALARAAKRGVDVRVLVDGVGTEALPESLLEQWRAAGVQTEVYAPLGRLRLLQPSRWQRLHRKLCWVDAQQVFCGGINILDDFREVDGEVLSAPRLDYAVQITGPLVRDVAHSMQRLWRRAQVTNGWRRSDWRSLLRSLRREVPMPLGPHEPGDTSNGLMARFVEQDNVSHRRDIERMYLRAIHQAQHDIVLAHAYFLPGRRMRQALRQAVARGVRVRVLLQVRYENFMQFHAAGPIHQELMRNGVELFAYQPSALHAKAAVVDGQWATLGSSNLDPLSLLLAREANVEVLDADFARQLKQCIEEAMASHGQRLDADALAQRPWHQRWRDVLAHVLMRAALWLSGKRY